MGTRTELLNELTKTLPYLRRYARALSGDQVLGDRMVEAMLRTLETDVLSVDSLRVQLFSELSRQWNPDQTIPRRRSEAAVDRQLAKLTEQSRQAFLLVAMERFSLREAAQVLDLSMAELSDSLALARDDIQRELKSDVLIIEDEFLIAADIERIVRSLGHNVLSVERTRGAARAAARRKMPDLVIADIRLADDSSGIEAVNDILADQSVPVVFITAYPERLLTGLKPEPIYLISKPFTIDEVRGAICQALFLQRNARLRQLSG